MSEIPLCYPKTLTIPKLKAQGEYGGKGSAVAFRKYDGTNIHVVAEEGVLTGFGTRRNRFTWDEAGIREFHAYTKNTLMHVPDLIKGLDLDPGDLSATFFAEFWATDSAFGQHPPAPLHRFRLVLFDIETGGGILPPDSFIGMAKQVGWEPLAEVLWRGQLDSPGFTRFLEMVRLNPLTRYEGAVVKPDDSPNFKVKSDLWLRRYEEWKQR